MALCRSEIASCKECGKIGPMMHTNGRQTQNYCDICKPIVEQREIHDAVWLLHEKGVTAEMYGKWLKRRARK